MTGPKALNSWRKLSGTPIGRWLFSRLVCLRAPYFASIRPLFEVLEPGRAVARIRKRRAVTNHIGTVHAIAMANLCELVAGMVTEVSVPPTMRWIPRGMRIDYLAKAETDLKGTATLSPISAGEARDITVPVTVTDLGGKPVVRAEITMYLSPRRQQNGAGNR